MDLVNFRCGSTGLTVLRPHADMLVLRIASTSIAESIRGMLAITDPGDAVLLLSQAEYDQVWDAYTSMWTEGSR